MATKVGAVSPARIREMSIIIMMEFKPKVDGEVEVATEVTEEVVIIKADMEDFKTMDVSMLLTAANIAWEAATTMVALVETQRGLTDARTLMDAIDVAIMAITRENVPMNKTRTIIGCVVMLKKVVTASSVDIMDTIHENALKTWVMEVQETQTERGIVTAALIVEVLVISTVSVQIHRTLGKRAGDWDRDEGNE